MGSDRGDLAEVAWDRLFSLEGRVAVVTGGGSGIGRAAVERLGQAGAHVVVADVDGAAAEAVAKELPDGRAVAIAADVATEAGTAAYVDAAVEAFGRIDCFFSNAGVLGGGGRLLDATLESWERTMGINLLGTFLGLQAVGRQMVAQGDGGSIVVTASIAGLRSSPGVPVYAASKAGVVSLVRTAAKELGPEGIRVNAICPAATLTNFTPGMRDNAEQVAQMRSRVPLGRMAEADDMARAAVWLLTDAASYVNGVFLPVDGGQEA